MKVLASRKEGVDEVFICEIRLSEIQKVANKAGYQEWDSSQTRTMLAPGSEYPIAEGYDFSARIEGATKAMAAGYERFCEAAGTMQRFVSHVKRAGGQPS